MIILRELVSIIIYHLSLSFNVIYCFVVKWASIIYKKSSEFGEISVIQSLFNQNFLLSEESMYVAKFICSK